ncbi:hypothetical protein HGA64_05750 [Candidatus Falkowbacteria bacterium]|nr:hypothetical protein [Candidatus Falkowbacteria bacterium]
MNKKIFISASLVTLLFLGGLAWLKINKKTVAPLIFKSKEECEKSTGRQCQFGGCDYKCPNNQYWKGWTPTNLVVANQDKIKKTCEESGGKYIGPPPQGWMDNREMWIPCNCPDKTTWSFGPKFECTPTGSAQNHTYLNFFDKTQSSIYTDCQTADDCRLIDLGIGCENFTSINSHNKQIEIDSFIKKERELLKDIRFDCYNLKKIQDYKPVCSNKLCSAIKIK